VTLFGVEWATTYDVEIDAAPLPRRVQVTYQEDYWESDDIETTCGDLYKIVMTPTGYLAGEIELTVEYVSGGGSGGEVLCCDGEDFAWLFINRSIVDPLCSMEFARDPSGFDRRDCYVGPCRVCVHPKLGMFIPCETFPNGYERYLDGLVPTTVAVVGLDSITSGAAVGSHSSCGELVSEIKTSPRIIERVVPDEDCNVVGAVASDVPCAALRYYNNVEYGHVRVLFLPCVLMGDLSGPAPGGTRPPNYTSDDYNKFGILIVDGQHTFGGGTQTHMVRAVYYAGQFEYQGDGLADPQGDTIDFSAPVTLYRQDVWRANVNGYDGASCLIDMFDEATWPESVTVEPAV